ncbi:copper resistance protein CopC [Acuticoccus sp. MNP-M23]|uniref:copper resistance CopC family protein n=1 Tax=Acuticoccus sp. MNP-M23 TaxID=3072793 RepID=UPI0028161136|nr:copper resistance protein CopC [Acuticoccus sp. MNP-M23]WMS43485.1 copper resistance protein CopC [Acuticoccus sp. MNP-M23]
MKHHMLALVFAIVMAPGLALAHSAAKPGAPADGETLSAPPELVRLNFGDPMRITVLKLVGPAGEVKLARTDGMQPVTTLEARPEGEMGAGAYEIEWRGMSADGHIMKGTVDFQIEP